MCAFSLLSEVQDFNGLEEALWRLACGWVRAKMAAHLWNVDTKLMKERPAQLRHLGVRERTVTTRVGDVPIRRRYYVDEETGKYRCLLDERLKLPPRQRFSQSFKAEAVEVATRQSFRETARTLGSRASHSSVQTWLWTVGSAFNGRLRAQRRRVFEVSRQARQAVSRATHLFCEADGVFLRLQRSARKSIEAKLAIMYEGWEERRSSGREFVLRNKLVYAAIEGAESFWESLSALASRRWDLTGVRVVGGDGAEWIKKGVGYFAGAAYQLCRFHLARKIRECLRGPTLESVYRSRGDPKRLLEETRKAVAAGDHAEKSQAGKLLDYLVANEDGLGDYRRGLGLAGESLRGLGCIEGNADKIISCRMKKRGMAWSMEGARNMLAVLSLRTNGWLDATAETILPVPEPPQRQPKAEPRPKASPGVPSVHMPALDKERPIARLLRPFTKVYWLN